MSSLHLMSCQLQQGPVTDPCYRGRLPFNQKFQKHSKQAQMVREFLGKVFQENRKLLKRKLFNRNFPGRKTKWTENLPHQISENISIPHKFVLFSRNSAKWCFVRHWTFLQIQTGIFYRMESTENSWVRAGNVTWHFNCFCEHVNAERKLFLTKIAWNGK